MSTGLNSGLNSGMGSGMNSMNTTTASRDIVTKDVTTQASQIASTNLRMAGQSTQTVPIAKPSIEGSVAPEGTIQRTNVPVEAITTTRQNYEIPVEQVIVKKTDVKEAHAVGAPQVSASSILKQPLPSTTETVEASKIGSIASTFKQGAANLGNTNLSSESSYSKNVSTQSTAQGGFVSTPGIVTSFNTGNTSASTASSNIRP